TVRLWDVGTGMPTATLTGHTDQVNAVAFSPDGHTLATTSNDGTLRLWDAGYSLPTASARICALIGRNLTPEEWASYLPRQPYRRRCGRRRPTTARGARTAPRGARVPPPAATRPGHPARPRPDLSWGHVRIGAPATPRGARPGQFGVRHADASGNPLRHGV